MNPNTGLRQSALGGILLTLIVVTAGVAPAWAQGKLVIAVQPTVASERMLANSKTLKEFIEAQLHKKTPIDIHIPSSYMAVVDALKSGRASMAFMSAWPAQLATQSGNSEVALAEVREVIIGNKKVEAPYYFSYWVVPIESPHMDLRSLKGKNACFASPISTSGYVAPVGRMIELNLIKVSGGNEADPKSFFNRILFAGGYAQCWQALKRKQVDVTIIAGDVPETLYHEVLASTRIIEQQGPIPSHALVVRKDLKEPLRSNALFAIRQLGAPEHRELMRSFISSAFIRFDQTTTEEHLTVLTRYLKLAQLVYAERK
jgi:phosphonate transport system substrate-binding protein